MDAEYIERPHRWTRESAKRLWGCYAKRGIDGVPSGYYPEDFYIQVLKIARPYLKNVQRVLDYGCSSGTLVRFLHGKKYDVAGVDLQENTITQLQETFRNSINKPDLRVTETCNIPFPDESFDAVFCTEVLEHVDDEDRTIIMSEFKRVLRPYGVLVMTTPYREKLMQVICPECLASFHPMGHIHTIDEHIATRWLFASGFSTLTAKSFPTVFIREGDTIFYRLAKIVARRLLKKVLLNNFPSILCLVGNKQH